MCGPSFAHYYHCTTIVYIDKRTNLTILVDVQRNKYKEVPVYTQRHIWQTVVVLVVQHNFVKHKPKNGNISDVKQETLGVEQIIIPIR